MKPGTEPQAPATMFVGWHEVLLPGKRSTHYEIVALMQGAPALRASADASASMWRRIVRVDPHELGNARFAWQVPALMPLADLSKGATADAVVRVVFAFDGDHARLPWRDRMLFDMAEGLTGERPPYATLMYVWDTRAPLETVIPGARSDRIRKLVVESGPARLGRWLHYERNLKEDFRRAFGEDPGALIGIGVLTDSDNTESVTEAYYREVEVLGLEGQRL